MAVLPSLVAVLGTPTGERAKLTSLRAKPSRLLV
jgi:hypothetical protein